MHNKLSELLPDSILWYTKNNVNSNLYKTLEALNEEQEARIKPMLDDLYNQYNPFTVTDLIDRWEKTVGIPDSCFTNKGISLDQRRNQVLIKLLARGATTEDDYARILELFGITNFNIVNGLASGVFPLAFPSTFASNRKAAVFDIIFQLPEELKPGAVYPLEFPFQFGSDNASTVECFLRKIVPANYNISFQYIL